MNKAKQSTLLSVIAIALLVSSGTVVASERVIVIRSAWNDYSQLRADPDNDKKGYQARSEIETRVDVRTTVLAMLKVEGIDTDRAERIIHCESTFNEKAIGDNGQSKGLWQIYAPAHPSVSDECALDAVCSTEYAISLIKSKRSWNYWSCNNLIWQK